MSDHTGRAYHARLLAFFVDESGQGIVEYGLILGLIAMVAIGALLTLGGNAQTSVNNVAGAVGNDTTSIGAH